ncbi:MAG: ASKHA domain-containing protein [Clostridia bacterium]
MSRFKITEFDIQINKNNVLNSISCFPESPVYDHVSREYDKLLQKTEKMLVPEAYVYFKENKAYCLMTAGAAVSDYSKELFDSGEGLSGLIVNAIADDFVFSMDSIVNEFIKAKCGEMGKGISKRLEVPSDLPPEAQREIIAAAGECGVSLTEGMMLEPVKTCGYILELTDDSGIFNAQHDCTKCKSKNCPRRTAPFSGEFEALSDYEYSVDSASKETIICIDIGTTTIAFELIKAGKTAGKYTELNTQRRFGADVLSRIDASNRGRLCELRQMIQYQLINGIKRLVNGTSQPDKIIIAANTTMVYLLMGYSCEELGAYPFKASHLETIRTSFDKIVPNNEIYTETVIIGGISAFVGGDITSGLYMCDFDLSEKINMFIDLGTNGEMAIGGQNKIIVTSTAAGPAFEGGRISCGTGSVDGAVCGLDIKSGKIDTINNKIPSGLCGTGIIELVSELLNNGYADETGLFISKYFKSGYPVTDNIIFTQNDMREVQTAKGAIRGGIETLMYRYGAAASDIDTLYLAGGFGYGLKIEKSCGIGLIPYEFCDKVKILGNSSLGGCAKYALQDGSYERLEKIKKISSEISLGNDEKFSELYIKHMNFSEEGR